ncbi:hypothetical protein T484DRAFT_1760874 [Baffinella frigidus]|nr:hypothetical protein T484DRAFT_1760874 [Cryptophyta sp. CCMP2293]
MVDPVLGVLSICVKGIQGLMACLPTPNLSSFLPKGLQQVLDRHGGKLQTGVGGVGTNLKGQVRSLFEWWFIPPMQRDL